MARSPFIAIEEKGGRGDDELESHGILDHGISEQTLLPPVS